MMLLDGKALSKKITQDLKIKTENIDPKPKMAVILVGDDYASKLYVKMKKRRAEKIGMICDVIRYDDITTAELISKINLLNKDDTVDGIMLQLPLPEGFDKEKILNSIDYTKDIDGLTATSLGLVAQGKPYFVPATSLAVIRLLDEYKVDIVGKDVVIIGASSLIGIPLGLLLRYRGGTVTLCHSRTQGLDEVARTADILISATGKPHLVNSEFVKKGAVVIDVGIEQDPETGAIVGDVDTGSIKDIASAVSPVPGGVGPLTIAMLLSNLMDAVTQDPL
ncbi:bifunctional 5,10-methylenetetrahydrofolate dehydrogenase/5,10-methenyltetrahydrofolate cyclohydrolase [Candidatus Dojkabacteria bacterium]|nr:bifunctional 5,10-methylenetetrahydrofolate dehydrogenase/5,10-methenyltetrahydrofolate cyclohydrolase [Candidatus Dojkabacteria bacterium]